MTLKAVEDQVVVVVGATSGIGRAAAVRFAEQGSRLVIAGRSQAALDELAAELAGTDAEIEAVVVDVSDWAQVEALASRSVARFGRIDTWVHTAAVSAWSLFDHMQPDEFQRIIEVDLLGQAYGLMAALPHLKQNTGGVFISTTSVGARIPMPYQSAYASAKHGVEGLLDTVRLEMRYEGYPVTITNVLPASINTPLYNKALTRLSVKPAPIRPVYEPDLVAEAILYAAEHPVRDLYVGVAGFLISVVERFSRRAVETYLLAAGFQQAHSQQYKPGGAPNNLRNHLEGYDRINGDFSKIALKTSLYDQLRTVPALRWAVPGAGLGLILLVAGRALFHARSVKK